MNLCIWNAITNRAQIESNVKICRIVCECCVARIGWCYWLEFHNITKYEYLAIEYAVCVKPLLSFNYCIVVYISIYCEISDGGHGRQRWNVLHTKIKIIYFFHEYFCFLFYSIDKDQRSHGVYWKTIRLFIRK